MTRLANPLFGFDYTSAIAPSTLRAYGVRAVVRYLSRSSWKVLTKSEAQALEANGIGIALVFEDGATNAWNGETQGRSDAEFAFNQAKEIFGGDRGGKITFAVDHATNGAPQVTDPYFDGVALSPLGKARSGPYGDVFVVSHQANRGFGALYQTYAWSGSRLDGRAQIFQYSNDHRIGPGVDYDHFYYADYGQWNARPVPPHPVDRYAIFSTTTDPRFPNLGNERLTVEWTDGALAKPKEYRGQLKGSLYYQLKLYRDRLYIVSWYLPPKYKHRRKKPDWSDNRGRRWHEINNRMKRIAAL